MADGTAGTDGTGGRGEGGRPRVVVIGGGFAGLATAGRLTKLVPHAEVVVVSATDYFLYLPLLPEVATGVLDPRRVAVPLATALPGATIVVGTVDAIDLDGHTVGWTDPEGGRGETTWDRLVIAAGSTNRLLPIPGIAEHAHGFRGVAEAVYLRDHIVRQLDIAASEHYPAERDARCTFVVVGAGYTGTEIAAQGVLFTDQLRAAHRSLRDQRVRWLLVDLAPRVLPELSPRLSRTADEVLRGRGVEVRTGISIEQAHARGVRLTTGEEVPTRTVVWCVGVRPDPIVEGLGLATDKGRLVVDDHLRVPGRPDVLACGDIAAVPDRTRPGQLTAMTAQHAQRQGTLAGRNVAASLGVGDARPYSHHDLGFVVELGGRDAAANPLGVPLSGLAATAVTRGYHLVAMPGNRIRVVVDWLLDAVLRRPAAQLGLVRGNAVPLGTRPADGHTVGDRDAVAENDTTAGSAGSRT
ncbi:NAD(P)/FAD-dependent oxidoreductase [Pseudonocardia sp. N23]|uniref:NAD(P)/FAD-dependent oxidoreductase n=1 Tax=Pseudonocardia sp. N23 TaxID=1987376 RepID=UPI000BFB933E|nr:FAD-dependent oxidoreductase [Pseudonocardia sp. N23]